MTLAYVQGTSAGNGGNSPGVAARQFGSTIAAIRGRLRVTFEASSANAFAISKATFGYSTGTIATSADLNAAPLELLFSGGSGFSLSTGQQITSDWLNFITINLAVGAHWCVSYDVTAASPNSSTLRNPVSDEIVYVGAAPQAANQSGSGYTGGSFLFNAGIVSIEAAFGSVVYQRRRKLYTPRRWL